MYEYFGDRNISLCRELTKIHEEVIKTTLSKALAMYEENNPKGEFVLVIEGASEEETAENINIQKAVDMAKKLIESGKRPTDACKEIAQITGFKKSEIYNLIK